MSKLSKFPLFDKFFPNLANYWDLDNFSVFKNFEDLDNFLVFDNFPHFLIDLLLSSTPPTLLAVSISLVISTYDNIIVFNININSATILIKL